jgi:hypothetical protein
MQALEVMIDHGLSLLDEIRRRALRGAHEVEEGKPEPADLGLAFDRISRAVRFTVAQHERLEIEAGKTAAQREAEAAARQAVEAARAAQAEREPSPEALALKQEHDRRLRQAERAVKRAIDDQTKDFSKRDDLREVLKERLREREDLGLDRPVGAVVADICRAMRLPFNLALWEDEPWAVREAAEQPEGSPYAGWRRTANDMLGDDENPDADIARRGVGPP